MARILIRIDIAPRDYYTQQRDSLTKEVMFQEIANISVVLPRAILNLEKAKTSQIRGLSNI